MVKYLGYGKNGSNESWSNNWGGGGARGGGGGAVGVT